MGWISEKIQSKKARALLAGWVLVVLTYISAILAGKLGIDIEPEQLREYADSISKWIVVLAASYLGGQGLADAGKEKAKVEAEAAATKEA